MRNVADKSCTENQNLHFMPNNFFLKNRAVYVMWKNTVESDRPQITLWRALHAGYQRLQTHTQYM